MRCKFLIVNEQKNVNDLGENGVILFEMFQSFLTGIIQQGNLHCGHPA